jgi:P-type Cu+ transporter
MSEHSIDILPAQGDALELANKGRTLMYIAADGQLAGLMSAADALKPTSREAVTRLLQMGVDVVMITGDNQSTADAIAKEAGISSVLADVLPQDKAAEIIKAAAKRQTRGHGGRRHQ